MSKVAITAAERRACAKKNGVPCSHAYHKSKKAGRTGPKKNRKLSAYGELSVPGFASGGFSYSSERRRRGIARSTNYVAPQSGISTTMRTSNNPVMTASSQGGAVRITQREILTTLMSTTDNNQLPVGTQVGFQLDVLDVNPGLGSILSWGSEISNAFQEYKMSFRLVYTSSCPSSTPGQLLIAYDLNTGNPSVPTDKTQMSNFSGCVSGQLWAPLTSNRISSKKLYVRSGPVPDGQSPQIYDFCKILLAVADQTVTQHPEVYGTVYIEYTIDLYRPRLQFDENSIIFSQYETSTPNLSAAEVKALDIYSPALSLVGLAGGTSTEFKSSFAKYARGNMEVQAYYLADEEYFYMVFPNSGYYSVTMGCNNSFGATGAQIIAWPDAGVWDVGQNTQIWSIINTSASNLTQGALHEDGGDLPDNINYTQQNFVVKVDVDGTYIQTDGYINGNGWIRCEVLGANSSYRAGATQNVDGRCSNAFIIVSPVSGQLMGFFDPYFSPITPIEAVSGRKHFSRQSVKKVQSMRYRPHKKVEAVAASSVPVSSNPPLLEDSAIEPLPRKGWLY